MPAKAPSTSIECYTLSHLHDELASVQDALSVTETEETWDSIGRAITRLSALCTGNANKYPQELVTTLRSSARPINSALNSERTRLSGAATEFITTAATLLGSAFEPLIPHYLPTLLILCTKANKVFITRAKAAIAAFVEHTHAPMIIHYVAESIKDKSVSLRLAAAETLMLCMNSFNPPDLEKEQRAKEIEACIRSTAVDASADVRKVSKKIFEAYKILLPGRLQSFTAPLTPRTRKYLDIKGAAVTAAPAPRSQPPSRPSSSQSVRSTQSETRAAGAAQLSKHVRSHSTSQTTSQTAPSKRPLRAPTPEVIAPVSTHHPAPRRVAREEPRRLKVDMPPPDFIPTRTDTGPQRPMSATELHFPTHAPSERPMSGPQRVMRLEAAQIGMSGAVRTGPIRPGPFNLKQQGSEDGTGGEQKERVVGGARRVLRMPEPEPAPIVEEKGKAAASGPIRPRVISTSRSTPAVPLTAIKEDLARVKKLASSMSASSRPGATARATGTGKLSRTASAAAVVAQTAASRSRTRTAEKQEEKKVRHKTQEKEKTVQAQPQQARDKERSRSKNEEKAPTRDRTTSKTSAAVDTFRPAPTVTMRDKTNRMHSKTSSGAAKATANNAQKVQSKPRSSPDVPEVAPADIPLPKTPEVAPVAVQESESSPPALICFNSPQDERPAAAEEVHVTQSKSECKPEPEPEPEPVPSPVVNVIPSPADVPLPSSRPGSAGSSSDGAAAPLTLTIPTPHTPSPEQRPQRRMEVEQTPISALVASIQRGFLSMHKGTPLPLMIEEEDSMIVGDESEADEMVSGVEEVIKPVQAKVEPLFSKASVRAYQ
ncbi:clasp N terminal-domain-containing protein [Daedaleopsis nitida]|nr:clasp N terminal-domain-containing protein [Daedaleopsis nitida]